jgi:hypothetical protein
MIACRRLFCADSHFFRMPDFLEWFCEGSQHRKVKTYRSDPNEDFPRKAGIIAVGDWFTLTADERLIASAKQGCRLCNFVIAHELGGHFALDHHASSAVTKNFELRNGRAGRSIIPPTLEELEANFAGVFFQCGTALADPRWNTLQLADRACTDANYVRKAQEMVQLEVFQRALNTRRKQALQRVVL